jgi:peptidoglycan hydrolase-like protein with peptidoglycan-binding domain
MREDDLHYRPDPLGRLGRGLWVRETPAPFGRLPDDEDELLGRWRNGWTASERTAAEDVFHLGGSVGEGAANDRLDVAKVQLALHGEGRFDLDRSGGPTGYFSPPLAEAIRQRQADYGLAVDGFLFPGGETIRSLKAEAAARERDSLGMPLPARPGEPRLAEAARKADGVQVAVAPFLLAPAAGFAARWMLQEGAKRAAARIAAEVAKREATAAAQAARGVAAAAAAAPEPRAASTAAGATEPPKPELVSEAAVRAWLDAGRAGLALPMAGSRGDDYPTQAALDIFAQECRSLLNQEFREYAELIDHQFGSTKNGKGEKKQKEMVIKAKDRTDLLGANKADQSWLRVGEDPEDPKSYFHVNSGKTLADGVTPIARERRQLVGLAEKVTAALTYFVLKPEDGFDEDDFRAYARAECRRILREQIKLIDKARSVKPRRGNDR